VLEQRVLAPRALELLGEELALRVEYAALR
jgi:hypothetical protein